MAKSNTIKTKNEWDAIVDSLESWIANGETLRAFCRQDGMPSFQRVYEWLKTDEDAAGRIARARDIGEDAIAQECLDIADTPILGEETKVDSDGSILEVKRSDMLGHRKLQIDTRLKLLAKWNPRKYGDKMQVDNTSSDGSMTPTKIQYTIVDPAAKVKGDE